MKPDKKKLLQAFSEISTPQELFLDTIERIEKTDNFVEETKEKLLLRVEKVEDELETNESNLEVVSQYFDEITSNKIDPLEVMVHEHEKKILSKKDLLGMIDKLIPDPIPGKDGALISPEEIKKKIKELKGKDRVSVFDLKDTEFLRGKDQMNWSSAGFKVYTDKTLTGDGSFSNPLSVVSGGGSSTNFIDNELVAGNGTSWTLAHVPVLGSEHVFAERNRLYPGDYTISGSTITTTLSYVTGDLLADYRI